MNKYSEMSDFEINNEVECTLDERVRHMEFNEETGEFMWHSPDGELGETFKARDYCNNPSDAWPIIEQLFDKGSLNVCKQGCVFFPKNVNLSVIHADDTNPLRSAMIVFLMMKDAENDNKE